MEEAPENGKESSNSAHANGMNESHREQVMLEEQKFHCTNQCGTDRKFQ
jgi:hypothetical protein